MHAIHWYTSPIRANEALLKYKIRRAIARDPDVYPDPEAFKPERWLNAKGEMRDDLKYYNWGFGRRCDRSAVIGPTFCGVDLFVMQDLSGAARR